MNTGDSLMLCREVVQCAYITAHDMVHFHRLDYRDLSVGNIGVGEQLLKQRSFLPQVYVARGGAAKPFTIICINAAQALKRDRAVHKNVQRAKQQPENLHEISSFDAF